METVPTDRHGLEVLDLETCLELAASVPVGRVATRIAGEIAVLPVNHLVDVDGIAWRSAEGSKLDNAIMQRGATFEVDEFDEATHTGWSVQVTGVVDHVDDDEQLARLEASGLVPWTAADLRTSWVLLRPTSVSGRRIHVDAAARTGE